MSFETSLYNWINTCSGLCAYHNMHIAYCCSNTIYTYIYMSKVLFLFSCASTWTISFSQEIHVDRIEKERKEINNDYQCNCNSCICVCLCVVLLLLYRIRIKVVWYKSEKKESIINAIIIFNRIYCLLYLYVRQITV